MAQEVIYSINAVKSRLLHGDGLVQLILKEGKLSPRLLELERVARELKCPVLRKAQEELDRMSKVSNQGVALVVVAGLTRQESFLEALLDRLDHDAMLLVLDGVTDPRNLGACLRSAATLGVDAVVVPKDNSAPLNEAAIKTASGGAAIVPLVQVTNLARCLDKLRRRNIWVVGTLLDAPAPIHEIDLKGNIAIVLGAEDKGLRRNTIERCDFLARIPMVHGELGFNVSVACGVCLYEATRQRGVKPTD